jgi:phosphatidate phosphatase LPIN
MATLRDIRNLYGPDRTPFTAGFGNRLTDQISYRTVDVPRNRIFTINSNAEVSLDLLSLNKLKMSYVNINEVVDHYFPPVSTLVKGGGEDYTDFKYWRDEPLDLDAFSASGSDEDEDGDADDQGSAYADEDDDEEVGDGLADSYISRDSYDDGAEDESILSSSVLLEEQRAVNSLLQQRTRDNDDDGYEVDEDGPVSEDETALYEEEMAAAPRPSTSSEKKRAKRKSDQRRDVVEDASAELITGVGHLSLGKDMSE